MDPRMEITRDGERPDLRLTFHAPDPDELVPNVTLLGPGRTGLIIELAPADDDPDVVELSVTGGGLPALDDEDTIEEAALRGALELLSITTEALQAALIHHTHEDTP